MTFTLPVWLLWTLGIVGGTLAVAVVVAILVIAWFGLAMSNAVGRGLNW